MRQRRHTHDRARNRRHTLAVAALCGSLIASIGLGVAPAPASAAAAQQAKITAAVGTDRVVTVSIACAASKTCSGSVKLVLSAGGAKTLSYSVAKRSSKLLNWTLTAAQYRTFTAKKQATLTVSGTAKKPSAAKFAAKATVKPATPQLTVTQKSIAVGAERTVPVALRCAASAGCVANVQLQIGGKTAATQKVSAKSGAKSVTFTLSQTVVDALAAGETAQRVVIAETSPEPVSATTSVTLTKPAPEPEPDPERGFSKAYVERNWTPTEYDTCPAELHASYRVLGPDGKYYPTWHPAQVTDPATGQLCTFGHEHGADPATSDISDWVAAWYAPHDLVDGEPTGLPFGYTSEELDNYVHEHGDMSMRHEDNGGHKVFVANNVKMLDANRNWLKLDDGSQLTCDFLIKQHQGSWSPDATSNNAHEILYAAKCTDGTEIITSMLSRFGNANEMFSTCATEIPIPTVGSTLPAGEGGKRIIPTQQCVAANPTDWSLYELWQGENAITSADGAVLARFDPWFGIRNPSRIYDARTSSATVNGISRPLDLAWLTEGAPTDYLWAGLAAQERFDYRDPRSPFDGAQRDFYLADLQLADPGTASGIVYTDPYGGNAQAKPTVGSVPQLIHPGSVLGTVQLARQKFDAKADFGLGNGVHAPN